MTSTRNLITELTESQFVTYNALNVAFYDVLKDKGISPTGGRVMKAELYICIRNKKDTFSIVKRKVTERFVEGMMRSETELYRTAYNKYLAFKNEKLSESSDLLNANQILEEKIKELEAKVSKSKKASKSPKVKPLEEDLEIKEEDVILEEQEGVAEPVLSL
jgi:hypothetical protein